jgi:hypothetical protein
MRIDKHQMEGKGRVDNFGHLVANPMTDILDVPGEKEVTPERLRFYRNGSRVFLQYGTDNRFEDIDAGVKLKPDSGDTITGRSAERIPYPVGFDLIATMAFQLSQAPQSGDVIAGGFGDPDVDNFDPSTHSYSGSSADGYFFFFTESTGLDRVFLAEVRDGTIVDSLFARPNKGADIWKRVAIWLNWYDVGPGKFIETFTSVGRDRTNPQRNRVLGSVANDDGKGPLFGSKRVRFQVHQDSANSGLVVELGSISGQIPGRFTIKFKDKSHDFTADVSNATSGTFEVVGALKVADGRERVQCIIDDVSIASHPSADSIKVLVQAVDPSETNYQDSDFSVPVEHSETNSVIRQVEGDGAAGNATGPVEDDSGTDSSGPTTSDTMTNPGGYQIASVEVNVDQSTNRTVVGGDKSRVLTDTDYGLVLIDGNTTGTYSLEIDTKQNA